MLGLALLENPDNRTHLALYAGLLVASQSGHLRNLLFRDGGSNNCCIFLKTEIQGWAALLGNFSVIDFKLIILKIIPARPGPHLSRRKAMIQPIFNRLPLAYTPIFGWISITGFRSG